MVVSCGRKTDKTLANLMLKAVVQLESMFELLRTLVENEASVVGETSLLLGLGGIDGTKIVAAATDDAGPPVSRIGVMVLAEDLRHVFAGDRSNRATATLGRVHCVLMLRLLLLRLLILIQRLKI